MSTFRISGFTVPEHTITVKPAGFADFGRECWEYELFCGDRLVFSGGDIQSPPRTSEDEVAATVLAFLTLRPGDTDAEYFDAYSAMQADWCQDYAEYLSCALITEDGEEVTDLCAYRVDDFA